MGEIDKKFEDLELEEEIFKDVKFYISGQAPDAIGTLLKNGGAERMNYFSDYVTHLICGLEPEESDLTDATDLYEIPAVSCKWVLMCAKTKSLVHTKPYLQIKRLFSGLNFCLSVAYVASNKRHDRNILWAIITFHGGTVQLNLDATCQYLVSVHCHGAKYKRANERMITVVTPDWIVDSVKNNALADVQLFHPKLITWPKPSTTAAITGFQDVEQIERVDTVNTASFSDGNKHLQLELEGQQRPTQRKQAMGIDCDLEVNNSTQALLDKLKSRMPWNQPQQQQAQVLPGGVDTSAVIDSAPIQPQMHLQNLQQLQQSPISSAAALYQQQPLQSDEQNIRNAIAGVIQQQQQNVSSSAPSVVQVQSSAATVAQSPNQQPSVAPTAGTVAAGAASFNRILEQLQQSQQQRTQGQSPTGHQLPISTTASTCIPQQQQQQPFLQQQFLQQQRLRQPQTSVSIQQQQQQQQQRMSGTPQQQQQHVQLQRQLQLQQQLRSQGPVGAIPGQQQQHMIQRMQQPQPQAQHIIQPHTMQTGNLLAQQLEQGNNQQQQLQTQYPNQQQQSPLEKQQQHYNMLLQQKQQLPSQSQTQQSLPQLVNATPSPPYPQQQQQQQFISQQQTQQPFPQNNNSFNTHQQQFAQQQQLRMIGLSQQQQQQQFNQQSVAQPQQQQRQWPLQQPQQQQIRLPTQQGQQPPQQQQQVHRPWPPQTVTSAQQQTAQIVQQPLAPPAPQPQRQLIHLDAQTHQQLQQMAPEQRALFVAKLQKQRHLMQLQQQRLMQQQQQQQQQQRAGPGPPLPVGPGHIVIRSSGAGSSNINHQPPPGLQALQLSPQQQHWVQQQKQQSVQPGLSPLQQQQQQQVQQSSSIPVLQPPPLSTPASLQVNNVVGPSQPLGQQPMAISNIDQQQQQLQLRHHYRLQQMQAQREQSFKLQQQVSENSVTTVINAIDVNSGSTITTTGCISSAAVVSAVSISTVAPLVVNPKTKTALANMLSNRLHSGNLQQHQQQQLQVPVQSAQGDLATAISSEVGHHLGHQHPHVSHHNQLQVQQVQPSAASTLKLLTANHNAQLHNVAPPPPPSPHPLSHGHGHTHIPPPQHLLNHPHAQQQQRRNIVSGVNSSSAVVPCQGQVIRAQTGAAMAVPPSSNQTPSGIAVGVAVASQHQLHQQPQHRPGPGPFYGHNPNLKLPSELFLLGCIFVCVEIGSDLDASVGDWRQRIERHGGELEAQYCARVTHVLCGTQRHGVVMQALRDYKRCVTAYWLADTLLRRKVEPPSAALHLPAVTLDSPPGTRHLVALSGFAGTDRERIKYMIKLTGAQYTNYFSRHNSVLVAARPDGPKFAHARKWGTPAVSVHWLTDVLLGHCGPALAQLDHAKYQQWMEQSNTAASIVTAAKNMFAFDAALVPSLMQAWKMPINISQESYERVKRTSAQQKQPHQIDTSTNSSNVSLPPPSIRPPKRARLDVLDQLDTNDSATTTTMTSETAIAMEMTTTTADVTNSMNSHRILFSTCTNLHEMRMAVLTLGGVCARSHRDATHLVMSYLSRTNKLLLAVARGLHVVSDRWLRDSLQAGKFLQDVINNYSLDSRDFNTEYKCDLDSSLRTSPTERQRLLAGRIFFLTPSLFPRKQVVAELIHSCGGTVERVRRSAAQIESAHAYQPHSYIVVTHAQDLHLVADLLAKGKGRPGSNVTSVASITVTRGLVCNVELVLSAILRQVFEVEPYAVKVL